jgi:hypothetical protein
MRWQKGHIRCGPELRTPVVPAATPFENEAVIVASLLRNRSRNVIHQPHFTLFCLSTMTGFRRRSCAGLLTIRRALGKGLKSAMSDSPREVGKRDQLSARAGRFFGFQAGSLAGLFRYFQSLIGARMRIMQPIMQP